MKTRRHSIYKKRTLTLLIAVCVSLALIDAIKAFSLVFLPQGNIRIISLTPKDGDLCAVEIVSERVQNDLFSKLKTAAADDADWEFRQGESGVSWTALVALHKGAEIEIHAKKDSKLFFTVLKNRWNDSVIRLKVDGMETRETSLHAESENWEIERIYPYQGSHTKALLIGGTWLASVAILYLFLSSFQKWLEKMETIKRTTDDE